MIEQSRALLEALQSVQEAEIERDNLAQFEQALTLLQRQRGELLQNG